jgi:large subunit ribosomal protein L4
MELPIYNLAGEQVDRMELPAGIFAAKINNGLMHQALVRQLANSRKGTHKAKGRSEVRYSTTKIYRQKGTGRARHGSRRAPIFVGGGVAHGPHPRSYAKKMPRKMRRAALRSALTAKATAGDIVLIDRIVMDRPKTKDMVAAMDQLVGDSSALILMAEQDENVELSARNIPTVKTLRANYLNIRDLLGFGKVVIPLAAMEIITGFLGREDEEWEYDYELADVDEDETMAAAVESVEEETTTAATMDTDEVATELDVEEDAVTAVEDEEATGDDVVADTDEEVEVDDDDETTTEEEEEA